MKEEQRITALVKELRKTIEGGNNLLLTVDKLADKSDVGESSAEPKDSEPFDIKDYQDTIVDATTFVKATNQLVDTVGLENLLPELISTIDRVESEGEELIDHSFRQAIFLILIALGVTAPTTGLAPASVVIIRQAAPTASHSKVIPLL